MRASIIAALISGPSVQPDQSSMLEFRFRADEPVFAGHFPGHPILPGIFQIEMTRLAAERILDCRLELREIVKAKFLRPILPEETIRLSLKLSEEKGMIRARAGLVVGGQSAGEAVLRLWRKE